MSLLSSLSAVFRRAPTVALASPVSEPVAGDTPPSPFTRHSNPGTPWSAWRPSVEKASELRGRAWPATAREMLRTDAKLAGICRILTQALLSARWEVVPGDASEESARNAEHVRRALGLEGRSSMLASGSFETELEKMLWYLPVGWRVLEELWRIEDGQVWLDGWGDIEPESVREWRRNDTGALVELVQERITGQPKDPSPLPAAKALILTLSKTGDDYTGTGLLRPCWGWWLLKQHVMDHLGVGAERWATPAFKAKVDRAALSQTGYTEEQIKAVSDEVFTLGQAYVSSGETVIVEPEGVEISTFGEGAYDPAGLLAVIAHANQEMATAWVSHFVEMGLGDVGSRATGQVHWNAWRQATANILDYLAAKLAKTTLARMLARNYYPGSLTADPALRVPASKLPRLRHVGLEVDGLADALGTLPSLISAGALTPDDYLERKVRRLIGMRDRPGPVRKWSERLGTSVLSQPLDASGGEGRPSNGPSGDSP